MAPPSEEYFVTVKNEKYHLFKPETERCAHLYIKVSALSTCIHKSLTVKM